MNELELTKAGQRDNDLALDTNQGCMHSIYDSIDCNMSYQTSDLKLRWGCKRLIN